MTSHDDAYCQFSAPRSSIIRLGCFALLGVAFATTALIWLWRAARWMFA